MPAEGGNLPDRGGPESVFCDTGVLINYMNQEWERDRASDLLESHPGDVVISESVKDEFSGIIERRTDIYLDFLEFVLDGQGKIEEFSPRGNRTANDHSHIIELQQQLSSMDEMEAAKRLRRFGRAYERRAEVLLESYIGDIVWTAPPLGLTFALEEVMGNANDATIVSDAADWANEDGEGNFAALDKDDILDLAEEINATIEAEIGPDGRLRIGQPMDFV